MDAIHEVKNRWRRPPIGSVQLLPGAGGPTFDETLCGKTPARRIHCAEMATGFSGQRQRRQDKMTEAKDTRDGAREAIDAPIRNVRLQRQEASEWNVSQGTLLASTHCPCGTSPAKNRSSASCAELCCQRSTAAPPLAPSPVHYGASKPTSRSRNSLHCAACSK